MSIIYVLRDLVPFVQWRSVTFSKVVGLLKATLLHGRFSRFLNCTNGTKSCNASLCQIFNSLTKVTLLIPINYFVSPKVERYQHQIPKKLNVDYYL